MKLKKILKESNAPGYKDRKFGGALPTLDSVKKAYEAKQGKKSVKEGKYFDSDIMAKWNSEKSIRKDLAQYIANAYELGGEGDHDRGMEAVGDTITTFRKGIEDGVKMVKKMSR